ncbi:glycosyltransferase family 61 protein [Crocosphaera sp. Alani8]|uniref:glycosyltransferase family 61 protein n=1 Tax=Crocosphaera sp. Alani8 TaxID=3038952 RepID=UPI00313D7D7D
MENVAQNIKPLVLSQNKIPTPEIKRVISNTSSDYSSVNLSEFYEVPPIYTATLNNVIFYPKYYSLFTKSRELISQSVGHHNNPIKSEHFSLSNLYFGRLERLSGTCTMIRSTFTQKNHYHCLIDYIPRIYLLDQHEYNNQEIKLLLCSLPTKTENFFLKKMLPENIKPMIVDPNKLYSLERVIFPSMMTSQKIGYLPPLYVDYLMSKVAPLRKRNKKNRIFISRSKSRNRRILNENELMSLLEDYGFKKYYLEELSIEEEIELFYDAEAVISPHGAGLANLIFSSNIKVLELFPKPEISFYYYFLCKSVNHDYHYWSNPKSLTKGRKNENFTVNLSEISKYLKTFF